MTISAGESRNRSAAKLRTEALAELVNACVWPSEAYWRLFELSVLSDRTFPSPVLELGCGDGAFAEVLGIFVDEGIDLNPRAVERAKQRLGVYRNVRCMDARQLSTTEREQYATIFANSVLEHVPDVGTVLQKCYRLLQSQGVLVATVPLLDMSGHLLVRWPWYAEFRRRQLQHYNLWSSAEWRVALRSAGFQTAKVVPYLTGTQCRFWDRIDVVGTIGVGRYRVAPAIRNVGSLLMPTRVKAWIEHRVVTRLLKQVEIAQTEDAEGCAALLIATKIQGVGAT